MGRGKKYFKWIVICLVVVCYLYFFILNNFHKDFLNLNNRLAFQPDMPAYKAAANEPIADEQVYIFPKLKVVSPPTLPYKKPRNTWQTYNQDGLNTIAVYLTDTSCCWPGLAHAFRSFGVPVSLYTDLNRALKHKVVMLYPFVSGKNINAEQASSLEHFVSKGGTLLATNVLGSLYDLFGIGNTTPGRQRYSASLVKESHAALKQFTFSEEQEIRLGKKSKYTNMIGTNGYTPSTGTVMIRFNDGTSMLQYKKNGKGTAYSFGMDLGEFFSRCQNSRGFDAESHYVNGYEPSMDVLMRIIKSIYKKSCPYAVTLCTVPYDKDFTMCMTHDIDYTRSIVNAIDYSRMEKEKGVKATYYIQTKYVKDWNDDIFYNENGVHCVSEVLRNGMEIGSHSVSHSYEFARFPYGTGKEVYPAYRPFVLSEREARNGSVMGELRVSKYLLETFNPGLDVVSFRAGHLANPFCMPEALLSTNYKNSSNVTANSALTHLPFQLNYHRNFENEVPLFEYPVTIEDEEIKDYTLKYKASVDVCNKVATYGGFVCVLLHTDTLGAKIEYEKKLIDTYKDKAWFSTIKDFDQWWTARNKVKLTVKHTGETISLIIDAPEAIEGLVIDIPRNWEDVSEVNMDYDIKNGKLKLGKLKGQVTFDFFE